MRFRLDYDHGHTIRGWIVPDNPQAVSRMAVAVDGRRVADLAANEAAEEFTRLGWHATGRCVFVLTDAQVPGLADLPRLELYDADTNVLVHRRAPSAGAVRQRVMLYTTGVEPETTLQAALFPHFQIAHFGIHRLSDEILNSLLTVQATPSVLLSGSLTVPRYETYCGPDVMLTGILVQDPHVELAARLLWLRARAGEAADPARAWRLGALAEAAAFAGPYDLTDLRALKRFFRLLPEPAYHFLYNPLTRQLGTRMPEDRLHPGNSIAAIEVLSRVGIVGHRGRHAAFASTLLDRIGLDIAVPDPPAPGAEVLDLAGRLRTVRAVDDMLVFDVAMSDAVKGSVDKSWAAAR